MLYERTGLSSDKKLVLEQHKQKNKLEPEDIFRNPYLLEFLGLEEKPSYSETDLEQAIINHLQNFLLELGNGFALKPGKDASPLIILTTGLILFFTTYIALVNPYYDSYSWTSKIYNSGLNNKLSVGNNLNIVNLPGIATSETKGMVTGVKLRTISNPNNLEAGSWLSSVNFYDDKGRMIQGQTDNIKGGNDISVNQYNFIGKVLCVYQMHHNPIVGDPINVKTNNEYDHAGNLIEVWKTINDLTDQKTLISKNEYEDLGKLSIKSLGQEKLSNSTYGTTPLETLKYTYNIRNWLQSINKSYVDGTNNQSKFGLQLYYDWGFENNQNSGNIGGQKWRSIGDGEKRAYGFAYDKINRLIYADFSQDNGSIFVDHAKLDFDVLIGDGVVSNTAYDENGNIIRMTQKGLKGSNSRVLDYLQYDYINNSNKLRKVTDSVIDENSKLSDFKDGLNSGDDYAYDVNGNLISDKNKSINSIQYNHLNTPFSVSIPGKGKIEYTYDNMGRKLKKVVFDSTSANPMQTVWLYIDNFIYRNDTLEFFTHEEGRAKFDTSTIPKSSTKFDYDFFIKDNLGNVRMVLSERKDTIKYTALSFEGTNGSVSQITQDRDWESKTGQSIDIINARDSRPGNFGDNTTNGQYSMLVRKSGDVIGGAKLLKVMAGDRIHTQVDYYYSTTNANNSPANGIASLIANFATAIFGSPQVTATMKDAVTTIASDLNANPDLINILNTPNNVQGLNSAPKAYLNVIFFDDQFQYDQGSSIVVPVGYYPNQRNKSI